MTAADFRRIALSLDGAAEGSHMGAADFRVGGRIFATLAGESEGYGNLMFDGRTQAEFLNEWPGIFLPVKGGWGRMGITHARLEVADDRLVRLALTAAWKLRVRKNAMGKKSGSRRLEDGW